MNNVFIGIAFIRSFLDAIKEIIALLDLAVPDGGKGAEKLDLFKSWADTAIASEERFVPAAKTIWSMLAPLVAFIVAARKAKAA